ncbi:hypothetical protein BC332_03205 [Capsicum chinense]|nr:hypothetical protein BC332_03205 [Capsicum chinense]
MGTMGSGRRRYTIRGKWVIRACVNGGGHHKHHNFDINIADNARRGARNIVIKRFANELDVYGRVSEELVEGSSRSSNNFASFQEDPFVDKLRTQLGVMHPLPSPPVSQNVFGLFLVFFFVGVVFDKVWKSRKSNSKPNNGRNSRKCSFVPANLSLLLEKNLQRKESVEWVNIVLGKLWKVYRPGIENWIIGLLPPVDVRVETTAKQHNIKVDNPTTASKDEGKVKLVSPEEQKNYPFEGFNISDKAPKKLTKLINDYSKLIADVLLKLYAVDLPWHLVDEVYIPNNYGDEFHWVLAVIVLKERHIRVYKSISKRRRSGPSSKIQQLAKILPTYLDISGFLDQKVRTDWSMIEANKNKMGDPIDVEYIKRIAQQPIGSIALNKLSVDSNLSKSGIGRGSYDRFTESSQNLPSAMAGLTDGQSSDGPSPSSSQPRQ